MFWSMQIKFFISAVFISYSFLSYRDATFLRHVPLTLRSLVAQDLINSRQFGGRECRIIECLTRRYRGSSRVLTALESRARYSARDVWKDASKEQRKHRNLVTRRGCLGIRVQIAISPRNNAPRVFRFSRESGHVQVRAGENSHSSAYHSANDSWRFCEELVANPM
jgi:hypothetical protein